MDRALFRRLPPVLWRSGRGPANTCPCRRCSGPGRRPRRVYGLVPWKKFHGLAVAKRVQRDFHPFQQLCTTMVAPALPKLPRTRICSIASSLPECFCRSQHLCQARDHPPSRRSDRRGRPQTYGRGCIRKNSGPRRGHAMFLHETLGESLRRFELRRSLVRPPQIRKTLALKQIHDPKTQRIIRPHHGQVDPLLFCERQAAPEAPPRQPSRTPPNSYFRRAVPRQRRHSPARTTSATHGATAPASKPAHAHGRPEL